MGSAVTTYFTCNTWLPSVCYTHYKHYTHDKLNTYIAYITYVTKPEYTPTDLHEYIAHVAYKIHTHIYGAGNFAELCSEAAPGISSTNAQNSRITVGVFKRLARNQETRKAYSKTFAKLAPQHGHAFLDAI